MLTRMTKFQRLDYMQDGFIHLGYYSGIAEMIYAKYHEQLTRALDKLIDTVEIRKNNPNEYPLSTSYIVKHTSQEMTDNQGGVYDRRGKSYLYKNLLIHLYDKGYTASIVLVNS